MLKVGMTVRTPDGVTGEIDSVSLKTGCKLCRVNDRWFPSGDLAAAS